MFTYLSSTHCGHKKVIKGLAILNTNYQDDIKNNFASLILNSLAFL